MINILALKSPITINMCLCSMMKMSFSSCSYFLSNSSSELRIVSKYGRIVCSLESLELNDILV